MNEREQMSGKIHLKTKGLTVGYRGVPLIKEIDLCVEKGEILTLLGPNGSGKSTILKSLTKQLKLIGGAIYINEESITRMSGKELAKRQAVVLTQRMQTELMTCFEVVAAGRYPYTDYLGRITKDDQAKIYKAMETVHALELVDKDFTAISDGQRQRILLARAICQEPEIIILDEPTSFLDIRHKLELLDILRKMSKEKGTTVIMSLHEIDLAQKISDKIMCVKGDYIEKVGDPLELFKGEFIHNLYGVEKGSYNNLFGSLELPRIEGSPEVFVIAGGGTGIPIYRCLQKEGIPFSTGILFSNDVDYQVAKDLAVEVITEKAFCSMKDETVELAKNALLKCKYVLYSGVCVEEGNQRLSDLIQLTKNKRMLITLEELCEKN